MKKRKIYNPEYEKIVDHLLSIPSGPKRWREAAAAWLKINPTVEMETDRGIHWVTAREVYALVVAQNKMVRETQLNEWGTSADKNSNVRHLMEMPPGLLDFIQASDPTIFNDKDKAKDNFRKLAKTFPEFTVAGRI